LTDTNQNLIHLTNFGADYKYQK